MQIQSNKKIIRIIQTIHGHQLSPISNPQNQISITIFNEHLSPIPFDRKNNKNLDLEHLHEHISQPYSLQNTSLAWGSIQHQIRQVLTKSQIDPNRVLIFDSSQYVQKIPAIFNKFQIVKGYNYRIKLQSLENISEQKKALMKCQHVLKQIEFQFTLGNGKYKPGYIGEITFDQLSNPHLREIIEAYFKYSAENGCPIILSALQLGQENYSICFQNQSDVVRPKYQRKLTILKQLLESFRHLKCLQNIILYDLPILLVLNPQTFNYSSIFFDTLSEFIKQYGVTFGFNLLRYSKNYEKQGINQILKLVKKHQNNIILSSGIKFKTDLKANGGQGLTLYSLFHGKQQAKTNILNMYSVEYLKLAIKDQIILDKVLRANILKLMDWKEKKEEIKVQVFWKCDNCKNDFSQSIKAFGKFGKQFCSIKCLKSYNF